MTKKFELKNYLKTAFTNKLVLICLALSLVYFISGYLFYLEFVVSAIAIIAFIILPIQASFCILFFLHNFLTSGIAWDIGFTVTLVGFTIITLIKYIIGLKQKKYQLDLKVIICFSIAFLISLFASINQSLYNGAFLYLVYLPLIYLMFAMRKDLNIIQIVNYMLFGFLLSNCLALIGQILPSYGYYYGYTRYQAFTDNPNYLGMRAVFLAIFYFVLYFKKQCSLLNAILIYLFSAIVVFATQSKTSIILLALFTIIFIVLYIKQDFKTHIKHILVFLLVGIILCLACSKLIIQIVDRFIPDKSNLINSLLTGRDEIWLLYLQECVKNPITMLFGNGLLSQEVYIPSQKIVRTSHNLYLFLFYRFGIIGCIALGIGFYFMIKELTKNKTTFLSSLPLLWYLIVSFVDNTFLCFNITFLPLALLFMFNKTNKTISINENKENINDRKKDV